MSRANRYFCTAGKWYKSTTHAINQRNTSFVFSNCKIVVFCKTKIWTICIIWLRYIQSQYTCHIFPTSTFIYVQQIMTERYIEVDLVSKLTLWQKKKTWYKTFKISLHSWEPAELFCSEIVLKRTKSQRQTWNGKKRSCLLYEINRPV